MAKITPEIIDQIIQNIKKGVFHQGKIARTLGISESVVGKTMRIYFKEQASPEEVARYIKYREKSRKESRKGTGIPEYIKELIINEIDNIIDEGASFNDIRIKIKTKYNYDVNLILKETIIEYLSKEDGEKLKKFNIAIEDIKKGRNVGNIPNNEIKELIESQIQNILDREISVGDITSIINAAISNRDLKIGKRINITPYVVRKFIEKSLQKQPAKLREFRQIYQSYPEDDSLTRENAEKLAEFSEMVSEVGKRLVKKYTVENMVNDIIFNGDTYTTISEKTHWTTFKVKEEIDKYFSEYSIKNYEEYLHLYRIFQEALKYNEFYGNPLLVSDIKNLIIDEIDNVRNEIITIEGIAEKNGVSEGLVKNTIESYLGEAEYKKLLGNNKNEKSSGLDCSKIKDIIISEIDNVMLEGVTIHELEMKFHIPSRLIFRIMREYLKGFDEQNQSSQLEKFNDLIKKRRNASYLRLGNTIKEFIRTNIDDIVNGNISTGQITQIINDVILKGELGNKEEIDPYVTKKFIISCLRCKKDAAISSEQGDEGYSKLREYSSIYEMMISNPGVVQADSETLAKCAKTFEKMVLEACKD